MIKDETHHFFLGFPPWFFFWFFLMAAANQVLQEGLEMWIIWDCIFFSRPEMFPPFKNRVKGNFLGPNLHFQSGEWQISSKCFMNFPPGSVPLGIFPTGGGAQVLRRTGAPRVHRPLLPEPRGGPQTRPRPISCLCLRPPPPVGNCQSGRGGGRICW